MLVVQYIYILFALSAFKGHSVNPQGSWFYCDEGDYVEVHFKETYFGNCPKYAVYCGSYPYTITGDILTYITNIKGENVEIKRSIELVSDDTLKFGQDLMGKFKEFLLFKLKDTVNVPGSFDAKSVRDKYEMEYENRRKKGGC